MDSLVIVESPTKERTISKILSKGFLVRSSFGHVRDLPQRKLGVDIDDNFKPTYVVLPRAKSLLPQLQKAAKTAKHIYLATDFDREGEAIAWHLSELLRVPDAKLKRITFHEITPEAIKEALKQPRDIDAHLVDAQVARRVLDRLVGYKLSPLLWKKVRRGLSAGRVQSVAMRLICKREDEIGKFIPQEYWTLAVELEKSNEPPFWANIYACGDHRYDRLELGSKDVVDKILADLEKAPYQVSRVEPKERRRLPSAPFTTASLQQEASYKLGFRAQRTMSVAQQLYEGISLGGGPVGLITYMRTDSTFVAKAAQQEALHYIEAKFGKEMLPPKPRIYKTKTKAAQEAHEAIRPTSVMQEPDAIKSYLTPDQLKLYKLVWERFVASQMADAVYDTLTVDISTSPQPYIFRATGRVLRFPGFLALSPSMEDPEGKAERLPNLAAGDLLQKKQMMPERHFTEPPPRYNEASLVKMMEDCGIGRPSTYAPIIQTILQRGYVRMEDRRFIPTELGKTVDMQLLENFPDIVDVNFTAKMETLLDHIADGKAKWQSVVKNFWGPFLKRLSVADKEMKVVKPKALHTEHKCDQCGAALVVRESRYGRFLACSRYPICKYKVSMDKEGNVVRPEETGDKCELCGKPLIIRWGRRGKFTACSGYPECKFTKSLPQDQQTPKLPAEKCEICGRDMVHRRGRFGPFLACSGYPECKSIKKITY
ncbi:MAG: type I DNA topoisomerase [Elusimicrobia bacterium]|nr:type I DNA topoisomerase [Candidatus Obscuribacterium magneticum]